MKIKLLRTCGIRGESHKIGDIVDVDESIARLLVGIGKAERLSETVDNPAPQPLTTESAAGLISRKRARR
mgnify:CR=1 FL=1